jgi:vancomycin permeability regulator SanA
MNVIVIHGAGIYPDGSLQPHTQARADKGIEANKTLPVDKIIVCGKNEAVHIKEYMTENDVEEEKIQVEPCSFSTLSNLLYSECLLSIFESGGNPIKKVFLISNYWHGPRLMYDAEKILRGRNIEFLPAEDPRSEEEIRRDERWERIKFVSDKMLLSLGYGKEFDRNKLIATTAMSFAMITDLYNPIQASPLEALEFSLNSAIPPFQKELMRLERLLYKMMKVLG